MKLTIPPEDEGRIKNLSARLGCKPQTAARAALRKGVATLTLRDVEAELDPAELEVLRREREREAAQEALREIG